MNAISSSESSEAYIALGSNLGDREASLMQAITLLDQSPLISVIRCSSMYETDPVGYLDQPNFINMVIMVRTKMSPESLLTYMLEIELKLGRERHIRFGPRTLDLDLLWMGGITMETPLLTLPHPRMKERAFVLVPLSNIVPEDEPTGLGELVRSALEHGGGKEGIRLWKTCSWRSESGPFVS